MYLRKLEVKDASLMLEWMHDKNVVKNLRTNFAEKTIDDCVSFIEESRNDERCINLAIVSDEDEYMGTVSLKNINRVSSDAEFAITVRRCAMGKGYSQYAMSNIFQIGMEDFDLDRIYWCVLSENGRAVRFYEKQGYKKIDAKKEWVLGYENQNDLIWFAFDK